MLSGARRVLRPGDGGPRPLPLRLAGWLTDNALREPALGEEPGAAGGAPDRPDGTEEKVI